MNNPLTFSLVRVRFRYDFYDCRFDYVSSCLRGGTYPCTCVHRDLGPLPFEYCKTAAAKEPIRSESAHYLRNTVDELAARSGDNRSHFSSNAKNSNSGIYSNGAPITIGLDSNKKINKKINLERVTQ